MERFLRFYYYYYKKKENLPLHVSISFSLPCVSSSFTPELLLLATSPRPDHHHHCQPPSSSHQALLSLSLSFFFFFFFFFVRSRAVTVRVLLLVFQASSGRQSVGATTWGGSRLILFTSDHLKSPVIAGKCPLSSDCLSLPCWISVSSDHKRGTNPKLFLCTLIFLNQFHLIAWLRPSIWWIKVKGSWDNFWN